MTTTTQFPDSPDPADIREIRVTFGLTQAMAGEIVYVARRTWQDWELGKRKMPFGLWELFTIKASAFAPKPYKK